MAFLVSLIVSSLGFVAFSYGKGTNRFSLMMFGVALMVYPYFVDNVWLMLGIAAALLGSMWVVIQRER
jgi:hypothetical protein